MSLQFYSYFLLFLLFSSPPSSIFLDVKPTSCNDEVWLLTICFSPLPLFLLLSFLLSISSKRTFQLRQRRSQGILRPGANYKTGAHSSLFNCIFFYNNIVQAYLTGLLHTGKNSSHFNEPIIFKEDATLYNQLHMTHSVTVKDYSHSLQWIYFLDFTVANWSITVSKSVVSNVSL